MGSSTCVVLLVVAATSASPATPSTQTCDASFCIPLFLRNIRRTQPETEEQIEEYYSNPRGSTLAHFSLAALEDKIWVIQRLLNGSIWDLNKWIMENYAKENGDVFPHYLNPLIFNPRKVLPLSMELEDYEEMVLDFFKPVTGDEEPFTRLVTVVLMAMEHMEPSFVQAVRNQMYQVLREHRSNPGRRVILNQFPEAFSNYLDCLPYSDHHGVQVYKDLVRGYTKAVNKVIEAGDYYKSDTILEENFPQFQMLTNYLKIMSGEDARQKVKNTLNDLLAAHPRVLEIELRNLMSAVKVVLETVGSNEDPGIGLYIRYFFDKLDNGQIFESALKDKKISSYLMELWKFELDLIEEISSGALARKVEDWWMGPKPKLEISLYSEYMEKVLPVPVCFKDESFPKVKVLDHFLTYHDFFLMRLGLVPIVFLKYLGMF